MKQVAERTTLIAVEYLGHRGVIASCLLEGDVELALVDPGPTSSLANLRRKLNGRGIRVADLTALLLTHIHLDHAGVSGTLVRENPRLRVYVHERGARHLVNPARLLESARRLYRDAMEQLWGEFLAVPEENVVVLEGGEQLRLAGRPIEVMDTPAACRTYNILMAEGRAVAAALIIEASS